MAISKLRPTVKDVADAAGVSRTTASYVLSDSKHANRISDAAKLRILAASQKLGYAPDAAALTLQRGYSNTIVILAVTWDLATFYSTIIVPLCHAACAKGLTTIVQVASDDTEATTFLENIMSLSPYGLLLLWDSESVPTSCLNNLVNNGLPIVDLLPTSPEGIACITADRKMGVFLCTQHLISLGHREIGMILDTSSRGRTSTEKLAGYRKALKASNIEFDQSLLQEEISFGFEAGYGGTQKLLDRHPNLTAIICINDSMAMGAMTAAQDMGIRVPADLSIVGYGGAKETEYTRPRLTTVIAPPNRVAENAIETLIKIRQNPGFTEQTQLVPMELVVRDSTGSSRHSQ